MVNVEKKEGALKKTLRLMSKYKQTYILMLPGILFFLVIKVLPIWGLSIAFVDFKIKKGVLGSAFVGLKWFDKFFNGPNFAVTMRNTLVISLMDLLIAFPVPVLLALGFNEIRGAKYKRILQSVVYMPHFMSWVVISGITFLLFSTDVGVVNKIIRSITGGSTINFLTSQSTYWWMLLGQSIWKEAGWGTIIYLAAISQVDLSLYEAATVDGAGRFQRVWHVTIPSILPTLTVMFIMKIGRMLNISFEQSMMMCNDMVIPVADTLDLYSYRIGVLQGNYPIGTAVGVFKSVIGFILVYLSNWAIKKTGNEGMF